MNGHEGHQTKWVCWEGGLYRLYCMTCGRYTSSETQTPNRLTSQQYNTVYDKPAWKKIIKKAIRDAKK